jgi:hypothetical protein
MLKHPLLGTRTRTGAGRCLLLATALGVNTGCTRPAIDRPPASDQVADVVLALLNAPSDVRCLLVKIETDSVQTRSFSLTTGGSTVFTLSRLPVGLAVFTAEAYAEACADVTADSAPRWAGGPKSVKLSPGKNGEIRLEMKLVGRAAVSVDFGSNTTMMCAPAQSACTSNPDCCMGTCDLSGTDTGVGKCKNPEVKGETITLTGLSGERTYVVYPQGGGADCRPAQGPPFIVTLMPNQRACLPASMPDVVAMALGEIQDCTTFLGCVPCEGDECKPNLCFPTTPPDPAAGCPAKRLMVAAPGQATTFLIIPKGAGKPTTAPALPRLVTGDGRPLPVTMAEGSFGFAFGVLEPPVIAGSNVSFDMCGNTNLCGLVDFAPSGFVGGWSFGGGYSMASVFSF